jgi:hypothetical protein
MSYRHSPCGYSRCNAHFDDAYQYICASNASTNILKNSISVTEYTYKRIYKLTRKLLKCDPATST